MELRPWEFGEYTLEQFLIAHRGHRAKDLETMKKFRVVAWAAMAPHMKGRTTPEQWMPLPGDGGEQKGKLADLSKSERYNRAMALKERYKNAGLITDN